MSYFTISSATSYLLAVTVVLNAAASGFLGSCVYCQHIHLYNHISIEDWFRGRSAAASSCRTSFLILIAVLICRVTTRHSRQIPNLGGEQDGDTGVKANSFPFCRNAIRKNCIIDQQTSHQKVKKLFPTLLSCPANIETAILFITQHYSNRIITMASTDYKFEGWMGVDKDAAKGKMVWQEFPKVKTWEETDVDIQVSHCGICGSDSECFSFL